MEVCELVRNRLGNVPRWRLWMSGFWRHCFFNAFSNVYINFNKTVKLQAYVCIPNYMFTNNKYLFQLGRVFAPNFTYLFIYWFINYLFVPLCFLAYEFQVVSWWLLLCFLFVTLEYILVLQGGSLQPGFLYLWNSLVLIFDLDKLLSFVGDISERRKLGSHLHTPTCGEWMYFIMVDFFAPFTILIFLFVLHFFLVSLRNMC